MLSPGTVVGGYEVVELIAAGGMGAVYRARQLSLGREVALKVLSDELGLEESFRARFRREAMLQAALEHPHVVPVYEAGESPHGLFIAMRLLDGASLEDLAGQRSRTELLELLQGVADALDAAHAAGLVHRDLKPQNILIHSDHAYLADFGLTAAQGLSSMTSAGHFLGTVDYVSPEQIRDEHVDARCDVYSFGAVLYRCLSGSVPFPRETKVAVIYAQLEQDPAPASSVAPELPPELDAVLAAAMDKNPARRPATVGELLAGARAALAGGSPRARAAADPSHGPRRQTTTTSAPEAPAATVPVSAAAGPGGTADGSRVAAPGPEVTAAGVMDVDPVAPPGAVPAPLRARRRGLVAAATVAALALAALAGIAAGFAVRRARASHPAAVSLGPTRTLASGLVTLSVPSGWVGRTLNLPALFTAGSTAAGPASAGGALVAVGTARAYGPSLVPSPLRALGDVPPVGPAVATAIGLQGRIYAFAARGSDYRILFVPTGHGVATGACVVPAGGDGGGVTARCDRILSGLRTTDAFALDPRPGYAQALSRVLTSVSAREQSALTALRTAPDAAAQARVANAVAGSFTAADTELGRFSIGSGEVSLHNAIRAKLGAVATGYRALAAAALRNDPVAYHAAAVEVQSTRGDLAARLYELPREGY